MTKKRVRRGYWKDWNNVKKTINKLREELGYFPATSDFKENGYGGLVGAIQKYYGGLKNVREKLGGETHLEKRRSKWADKQKVLKKVSEIKKEIGHFPTVTEVKEMEYKSLVFAVYRYHNSWENIRLTLNEPKKYNQWETLEEVLIYLKRLIKELGHFPTKKELIERNKSSILKAIQEKYGGIYNIYDLLYISPQKKPNGYWKDFNNIKLKLEEISNEIEHFPTLNELRNLGYNGLISGIHRHHGGYRNVKTQLGIKQHQVENGYWEDFDKIKLVIRELQDELGEFPTIIELEKHIPGIKFAILKYHEGYIEVRKKLNEEIIQKPDGYWKDFKKIKNALLKLEKELGFFPTIKYIHEKGPKGLVDGIFLYHGGLNKVRKKLHKEIVYPSALEKYVKNLLDSHIKDKNYVDNMSNELKFYGFEIIDPETGNHLEIDRFYYKSKIAIEIQGQQHIYESNLFHKNSNSTITFEDQQKRDKLKKQKCQEQGVKLIEIFFYESDKEILNKFKGKLKFKKIPSEFKIDKNLRTYHKYKNKKEVIKALLEIKEKTQKQPLTSDIIRNENSSLYKAIKIFHGGIHKARSLVNEPNPRNPKGYWTYEKVEEKLLNLVNKNNKWPSKNEIQNYEKGLYYAVCKFGGSRYLKQKIYL